MLSQLIRAVNVNGTLLLICLHCDMINDVIPGYIRNNIDKESTHSLSEQPPRSLRQAPRVLNV